MLRRRVRVRASPNLTVTLTQVRTLTLEHEKPARLMVDGDIIGTTPLTVTVLPAAFTLYTPQSPAPS